MDIHLSPEREALLQQLASRTGKETSELVQEAVDRMLDHDTWFVQEVEKGLAQSAQGELIEHDEVVTRIEKHMQAKQRKS